MNSRWLVVMLLFGTGCQFNAAPQDSSLTGGPALYAFPKSDGIDLFWNNFILPYFTRTNSPGGDPTSYHILASETGPDDLSRIAELTGNTYEFSSVAKSPVWFAVEAEYENDEVARSNIVMSSSSPSQVLPVTPLEEVEFSAAYSELASGFPLFQSLNAQGVLEISTLTATESSTTLTAGRTPAPHPSSDQFIYISDPDNAASSPGSSNSLLLWNLTDSTVTPLVVGSGYIDKPVWSQEGNQIVYLSSAVQGDPTTVKVVHLAPNAISVSLLVSVDERYSGGGIEGPNFPSFFPGLDAIVMDVPSIESETIGRNILMKGIYGGTDSLLIQSPWIDTQPAVHPDGKSMVFVSDRAGSSAIWEIEFSTGNLRQLSGRVSDPVVSRDYPLFWSANGEKLWFSAIIDGKTSCYQLAK